MDRFKRRHDNLEENGVIRIGNIYRDVDRTGGNFAGNVFDINGIAPALRTMQGGEVINRLW